jgi:uncharacterized repeat protein (TIGR03803 family)
MDSKRNLYGTTMWGGLQAVRFGTVFELSPNGKGVWREQVLYEFMGGKEGEYPAASLTFDKAGNLYGTTEYGGDLQACPGGQAAGCGIAFKLEQTNGAWVETALHAFTGTQGHSYAGLIFKTGSLYCTTEKNGTATLGSVFEITP